MKLNVLIVGYGGQGVITLAHVIGRAAFKQGYDVKQAELHGLSQRMGSLQCHVRIGEKVFSPLMRRGEADVIIALEASEALRAQGFMSPEKTRLLLNSKLVKDDPLGEDLIIEKIIEELKEKVKEIEIVNVEKFLSDMGANLNMANTFLLAYSIKKGYLPISKENAWKALEEKIRREFIEENRRIFEKVFED